MNIKIGFKSGNEVIVGKDVADRLAEMIGADLGQFQLINDDKGKIMVMIGTDSVEYMVECDE
tara:strand:+ start:536 stop:721 length:186 start_codon:yes stop_codon:yes gene_type:complete